MFLFKKKLLLFIYLLLLIMTFPCYAGENIFYDGSDVSLLLGGNLHPSWDSSSNNTVTVDYTPNGVNDIHTIFGSRGATDNAFNNYVQVDNGEAGACYGGSSTGYDALNNTLVINSGNIKFYTVGGHSINGNSRGNTLVLNNGDYDINPYFWGGMVASGGEVTSNNVTINNGTFGRVYGGMLGSRSDSNTVTMNGGYIWEVAGGYGSTEISNFNTVIMNNGSATYMYGGYSSGSTIGNRIFVYGGSVFSIVCGQASSVSSGNSVLVYNGDINQIYGGRGSHSNYNGIDILSGNFKTVVGGHGNDGAFRNFISITGDPFFKDGSIIGGVSNVSSTENKIIVSGNPIFENMSIFGGAGSGDVWSGNTFHVNSKVGNINEVNNFEYYEFYIQDNIKNNDTIINITGQNPTDLTNAKVSIYGIAPETTLAIGDSITLISSTVGTPASMTGLSKGISFLYDIELVAADSLIAMIVGESVNPQTKVFSEGRAAGQVFLNRGSELTQGKGIGALLASTQQQGLSAYGTFSGGKERVETGSYVDVNGFSLLTGLGWGANVGGGRLTLGAFFEAGMGGYDSHNSFTTGAVEGDGSTTYYGGGLTGRYDYRCGGYAEASMRAGFSRTDFESGDIVLNGNSADFETSAGYYGGHFGLGYKWDVTDSGELDLYTKWLWTHLEDDDVTVLGDPVKFKDSDSHRWRTGARFEYSLADKIKPYVGAAYEYEFDGEIEATADGSDIDKPSLKGGTGVGEVGVRLGNLLEKGDLSIDLGLQGSVGQREGMGGSFQLKWLF